MKYASAVLRKASGTTITQEHTMRKKLSIAVTFLLLISTAPLLGACHTTAGAGEDISATGHALTNSADKHTP